MTWRAILERLRAALFPAEADDLLTYAERLPDPGRRMFLRTALLATTAAAVLDVDQLLWTPSPRIVVADVRDLNALDNGIVSADWIAREALRLLKKQLTLTSAFNRDCFDRFEGHRLGDTMRVRLPQRWGDDVVARNEALTFDVQPGVALLPLPADLGGHPRRFIEATLVPAVAILADTLERQGVVAFGELALPSSGVDQAARATDPATGASVRVVSGYDVYDGQQKLRIDVLGATRALPVSSPRSRTHNRKLRRRV